MAALCLHFKWLGFQISDTIQNQDYNGDPKTGPSKTGHFLGQLSNGRSFQKVWFSNGFSLDCSIWNIFFTFIKWSRLTNYLKTRHFRCHFVWSIWIPNYSKNGPFGNQSTFDHLNTWLVRISESQCMKKEKRPNLNLSNEFTWSKKRAQKRVNPCKALRQSKKRESLTIRTVCSRYLPRTQEISSAIQVWKREHKLKTEKEEFKFQPVSTFFLMMFLKWSRSRCFNEIYF